jgi:predicted RNA-binding Zn-ribbon protein involved in translation (DUF1610 family)
MRKAPPIKRHCPRCEGELQYVKTNSKYLCPVCSNNKQEFCIWSIQYLDGYDDCKNKVYRKPSKKVVEEYSYGPKFGASGNASSSSNG